MRRRKEVERLRRRMERKGEKGSEEDDYFRKFPPINQNVQSLLSICTKVTTRV